MGYFKVRIIKHSQILFGNTYVDGWHKDMVGRVIKVREVEWPSAYYEAMSGDSILKSDCERISLYE